MIAVSFEGRRSFLSLLALLSCACQPKLAEVPALPQALALRPNVVGTKAMVEVMLSKAVHLEGARWPIKIVRPDGRLAPFTAMLSETPSILLAPESSWPPGELLDVRIEKGFVDALGQSLSQETKLSFEVAAGDTPEFVLRAPVPGRAVPMNLSSLTLSVSPPDLPVERVMLESNGVPIEAQVVERSPQGLLRARMPAYQGPCDPLCPGAIYRTRVDGASPGLAAFDEVHTSTAVDNDRPSLESAFVEVTGTEIVVRMKTSEPVLFSGIATASTAAAHGVSARLIGPLVPSSSAILRPEAALSPNTRYVIQIFGADQAGNALEARSMVVETDPEIRIAITELVPTPLHDWGDSTPNGEPLDASPGRGAVTDADEWIELVNLSPGAIDLTHAGLVLRTLDETPAETNLETAPGFHFGAGGRLSNWSPGEALVVRPRGSMSRTNLIVEIASGDRTLDRITLGSDNDADHAGGRPPDLEHESLARDAFGRLRWCVPTPADPVPSVNCLP